MKRRLALKLLAGTLALGGLVFQLGGCLTMATNTGAASFDTSLLLDSQGRLFGLFAVCGTPDLLVTQNGVSTGTVINTQDNLVIGCPISGTIESTTAGTGGTGGTGGGTGT